MQKLAGHILYLKYSRLKSALYRRVPHWYRFRDYERVHFVPEGETQRHKSEATRALRFRGCQPLDSCTVHTGRGRGAGAGLWRHDAGRSPGGTVRPRGARGRRSGTDHDHDAGDRHSNSRASYDLETGLPVHKMPQPAHSSKCVASHVLHPTTHMARAASARARTRAPTEARLGTQRCG